MLPLDGLRLNASKPEPSLDIVRTQRIYRAKTSFGEWLQPKFTSRSSVSNRVYTSPNGPAGVTLRGALLFRGFEPYGRVPTVSPGFIPWEPRM